MERLSLPVSFVSRKIEQPFINTEVVVTRIVFVFVASLGDKSIKIRI